MVKRIGGVLVDHLEEAHTATHVIAGDTKTSIRRTPKLMIGLCCSSNIVNLDWLVKSNAAHRALPSEDFLILDDNEAEKQYKFVMKQTLNRISSFAERGTSLLAGWHVFSCKGVVGNKAPPEKEFRLIIEAAGGKWLPSLSASSMKGLDISHLMVITSDPETKKQTSLKAVASALANGAAKLTTSQLFHAFMTQKLDL